MFFCMQHECSSSLLMPFFLLASYCYLPMVFSCIHSRSQAIVLTFNTNICVKHCLIDLTLYQLTMDEWMNGA